MTTLKKHIEDLQKFAEKHPELLNKQVGYFTDDEGNSFSTNVYKPTVIYYNAEYDETLSQEDVDVYKSEGESIDGFVQHIVIN